MNHVPTPEPGAVALVGSGEYTAAMEETDRVLIATLGAAPHVAVIPTASGLEPDMPERWNARGVEHFSALGAAVTPIGLITRADAHYPAVVAALEAANFYYFSGGNPEYLVETLRDSPAWEVIRRRHQGGAAVAGCSAGAMMLGGYTLRVRAVAQGQPPQWQPALGLAPTLAVLPHFDRMAGFVGEEAFQQIVASAPPGVALVGIDEDTALVRAPGAGWRVYGRQGVVMLSAGARVYRAGELAF